MIVIEKSARQLSLIRDGRVLLRCPVSLGPCPEGHKLREGDGRTPEGRYRICSVNRQSKFHISLGLSYPSRRDAKAALSQKRIGFKDHLLITAAGVLHLRPKWTSPLGGYIMIHGESPEGLSGDWTQGCIAVSDQDIEKLASFCKKGEPVEIRP